MTDYKALCAELHAAFNTYAVDMAHHDLLERARAALAAGQVPPTDEELISPIMWMLDECVYDNDKGEIAQSLRELIARWGQS